MGQRSTTFEVYNQDLRQEILNSIRRYRAACRQCYGVLLLARAAGAEIEIKDESLRVKPKLDNSKIGLASLLGVAKIEKTEKGPRGSGQGYAVNVGAGDAYELRQYFFDQLYPEAKSFVWDSMRRDITTVWNSRDPEFGNASRGWLALQGARGIAQFNWRGIGLPTATAKPRLVGHSVFLNWDKGLGEVEFHLPNLDGGRYHVWRSLRDGSEGWKLGTLYLNERDGKIKIVATHERPDKTDDLDPERVCRVQFQEYPGLLTIAGPDGALTYDSIAGESVKAFLDAALQRRIALENRRAACGNPKRPWGHRRGWLANQDVLSRATLNRTRTVADYNHAWTRRIVTWAAAWRCGQVELGPLPEEMFGHPWQWSQLVANLTYKVEEIGGQLIRA